MDVRQLAARLSVPRPTPAQLESVARVLREIREVLGQTGGGSLLVDVTNFSPEVGALPLFQRVDGSRVMLAEAVPAAKDSLRVCVDAGGRRKPGFARSLDVDRFTYRALGCLFGGGRLIISPVVDEPMDELPAPNKRRRKSAPRPNEPRKPKPPVLDDLPPTPDELASLFADLEREAGAKQAELPVRPPPPATPTPGQATPPRPNPGERLVAAVQAELRALRRGHESLLTGFNLDHVRALAGPGEGMVSIARDGLVIDTTHPLVQQAIDRHADDRVWVSFVASRVYTAINVWREDITDADEAAFLARHLEWLQGELEL